jgi:hypothetical protein
MQDDRDYARAGSGTRASSDLEFVASLCASQAVVVKWTMGMQLTWHSSTIECRISEASSEDNRTRSTGDSTRHRTW